MAKTEKVNVRLTPEQLALLKKLAGGHEAGRELLAAVEKKPRAMGSFEVCMRAVLANPATTLDAIKAAAPHIGERNLKFDYRRAQKVVKLAKELGWREPAAQKKAA